MESVYKPLTGFDFCIFVTILEVQKRYIAALSVGYSRFSTQSRLTGILHSNVVR